MSLPGEDEHLVRLTHDLRTPLTVVSGFADLLERQADRLTAEQRTEYIHRIAVAAGELRKILDEERERRTPAA
jgi:signal transduction histidine kinase